MKVWFTSDNHFFHRNVIKYCNRPFNNAEEMNEEMIRLWNETVDTKDTVYLLGDFAFTNTKGVEALVKRLNGHIHWIWGNHDESMKNANGFVWSGHYKEVKVDKQKFILSHYPMLSWNGSGKGSIMLHGHCHGSLKDDETQLRMDVGVDCHNFKPISSEFIIEEMNKRKANNLAKFEKEFVPIDHH